MIWKHWLEKTICSGFEMGYSNSNAYNNMLGILGQGNAGGNIYPNQWANQANYYNRPETDEEIEARRKREEEADAEQMEAMKQEQERKALNRPKMLNSFAGSIVCLASAIFFISLNFNLPIHDYNTNVLSSLLWFMAVLSGGFTVFLVGLGFYYTN